MKAFGVALLVSCLFEDEGKGKRRKGGEREEGEEEMRGGEEKKR